MLTLRSAAVLSLAAVGSLASPSKRNGACMTNDEATLVADKFGELLSSYSADLANAVLTPDFHDYSESVNTLINTCPQGSAAVSLPLLSPTFGSREQFERGQGQQAPINFFKLQQWNACDSVHIRWKTTNTINETAGYETKPVVGLISIEVEQAPAGGQYPWLIHTVYSEFDAGAWLQNLMAAGICPSPAPDCSQCSGTSPGGNGPGNQGQGPQGPGQYPPGQWPHHGSPGQYPPGQWTHSPVTTTITTSPTTTPWHHHPWGNVTTTTTWLNTTTTTSCSEESTWVTLPTSLPTLPTSLPTPYQSTWETLPTLPTSLPTPYESTLVTLPTSLPSSYAGGEGW